MQGQQRKVWKSASSEYSKKYVISVDHRNNTPQVERQKCEELRRERFDKDSKDYLNFVTF